MRDHEFVAAARSVGLGQDDASENPRRPRSPGERQGLVGKATSRTQACVARDRLRVPALCPVRPHDGRAEHRLRPRRDAASSASETGYRRAGRRTPRARPTSRPRQALSEPALRRPAPARRACPRARPPASHPASRRAIRRLDAKVRRELRGALRQIHDELGLTSIFVTHDQEEAFALADRVALLNQGRIEQFAAPLEIRSQPASDFVRSFME